jgi:ferredoxin-like protein FixX
VRVDGTFIGIEAQDGIEGELAAKLAEVCPVDIYAQAGDGSLAIVEENVDECVLCRLCLDASGGRGPSPVRVLKLYDDGAPL